MSDVFRSCTTAVMTVGLVALAMSATAPFWAGGPPPVGLFVLPLLACAWLGDALAVVASAALGIATALYVIPGVGIAGLDGAGYLKLALFVSITGSVAVLVRRMHATEEAQRRSSADLREAERHLRQALDAARMVAWRWDPATDQVARVGRSMETFGLDERGTATAFLERVHPLDRVRYAELLGEAIARRTDFDTVFRLSPPGGRAPIWVEQRAAAIQGPGGRFAGFTGVAQDVTDRFALQAAVRTRELQLRVILDAVPALIAYVDRERRYTLVNHAYEEWFGAARDELTGRLMDDVLGAEEFETLRPHVAAALEGRQVEFETEHARPDGALRVLRASYVPDVEGDEVRGFLVLVLDVTDDRRREQALGDAEREARRANELKDQFLATLSHELRTPLNAMLGYARMAQAGIVPPPHALAVIERNARLQTRLVEDLLDVSRMASGKLRFAVDQVDPTAVVVDVVHMLQPIADAKRVSLLAEFPPDRPAPLTGDGARLRQMLVNLVSNAIKFTPEDGRVTVRLVRRDACLDFLVEDSGIGITPDLLPVIFDRFRQADSSATRAHGGLGLGLSIARAIAEAHGGTISATSAGPGRGATFTVALPVGRPEAREVAPQFS